MKIKFNWGTAILLVIIMFFIIMISVIVFSFNQNINLVTPEYYPKGVNHENQITKVKNTSLLKEKLSYSKLGSNIILRFPKEFEGKNIKGTAQFYYIADYRQDHKFDLVLNNEMKQEFSTSRFIKGRYKLKIDWKVDDKGYFQEIDLIL